MPAQATQGEPAPSSQNGTPANSSNGNARLSALSARELWRPSTPERLRTGWKKSPESDGWKALQKALEAIGTSLESGDAEFGDGLLWGAGEDLQGFADWRAATLDLIRGVAPAKSTAKSSNRKAKSKKKKPALSLTASIEAWCDAAEQASHDPRFALQCLTWAYSLPAIAQHSDASVWWRLAEQLDTIATAAAADRPGEGVSGDALLINQLLAGELPLVLAAVLPHARPWRALGKQATETLTEGVLAWTDGEGLPPGRGVASLGLLAGCWTRCRRLSYQIGSRCWDAAAQTQYEWLVRQLVRLSDRNGVLPLAPPPIATDAGLLRAALDCAADDSDLAAAALRLGARAAGKPSEGVDAPDASANSEWSGISVLSAGWGKKDARLLVTYDEDDCLLSLNNLGATLLNGVWQTSITINGAPAEFTGGWEEQCWFSDHDCDFLEIARDLEGGGRLERLALLAKQDASVMLLDIVHTDKSDRVAIEVETRLSLGRDTSFAPTEETREGWLLGDERQLAGVIPPAMAEWRISPRGGELTQDSGNLVLAHESVGRAIACPVWFDLKPKRFAKQRTWRQLTVAESLEPVSSDVAVGYRIQSGKDQWLLYRSLARRANRTVMGQNYSSEAFFGRFDPKTGLAEEFFEVEA